MAKEESTDPSDGMVQVHGITTMSDNTFTRHTKPFKTERVKQIVAEATIGPDIAPKQWKVVEELITEFADCFALSMKKVNTVPGAVHKLNILANAKFCTKVAQYC